MLYVNYITSFARSFSGEVDPDPLLRCLRSEGIRGLCIRLQRSFDIQMSNLAAGNPVCPVELTSSLPRDPGACLNYLGMFSRLDLLDGHGLPDPFPSFLERNREVGNFAGRSWEDCLPLSSHNQRLIKRMIGPPPTRVVCKHGPGGTAEHLSDWDKWLPFTTEFQESKMIRFQSVPKDFSKRRLIGIEPVRRQFIQQGVARALRRTRYFTSFLNVESLTRHLSLACKPSYMTIDMKDASDRIPLSLVEYLLPSWYPVLAGASTGYGVVGSDIVRLNMMATMGCGFCFELETIVFHLVCSILASHHFDIPLGHALLQCSVYGDDIVMPRAWYPALEQFCCSSGWVVNPKKTCLSESFKETVGFWIVDGVASRRYLPQLHGDKHGLIFDTPLARIDLANRCHCAGLGSLEGSLMSNLSIRTRPNHKLWRVEALVPVQRRRKRKCTVTGETLLLAYLLTGRSAQGYEDTPDMEIRDEWVDVHTLGPAAISFFERNNVPVTLCPEKETLTV